MQTYRQNKHEKRAHTSIAHATQQRHCDTPITLEVQIKQN